MVWMVCQTNFDLTFPEGFAHKKRPRLINLHKVRLCFQVILISDGTNPKQLTPLKPAVSDVICDIHKTNKQLLIHRLSENFGPPCGGKQIILLCDKVDRKDIKIRFYEKGAGETIVWEDWALFQPKDVHYQTAITFKTPRYKIKDIDRPVDVSVQLQVISGAAVSNAMAFQYVPESTRFELALSTKKRKIDKSEAFLLDLPTAYNIESSGMDRNIDPNEVGAENIAPGNSNVMPSNFFVSNNHRLSTQPQCYDNFYANGQHEEQFQQQPDYQQFQTPRTSDCQWPLQPLPNILPQPHHHHKQFEKPLLEQYNLPQYHPMVRQSEHNIEPSHGNSLSQFRQLNYQTDVTGNTYGAEGNFTSNNFSNFSRPNYQSPNEDTCPMSHQSCQQIGPVHAYDQVIIQQFVSNNGPSVNQQQQNVTAIQNAEGCSPDFSML